MEFSAEDGDAHNVIDMTTSEKVNMSLSSSDSQPVCREKSWGLP